VIYTGIIVDPGGRPLTVKRAFVSIPVTAVADVVIVPAVAGFRIRVVSWQIVMVSFAALNCLWKSNAAPITMLLSYQGVSTNYAYQFHPHGHMETVAGEDLRLGVLNAGGILGGQITYVEVP
jgi:hypothetical protein